MNTRRLGRTALRVTEVGLGTNAVGGHNLYENLSEDDGVAVVRRAVELGVNFIDTADIYGFGRSEELIREALRGHPGETLIATKGGNEWDAATKVRIRVNNRPEYMRRALEASLRRLGRETIDLYYLHRFDGETPLCDSFGELLKMKTEGKIRAAGLSNVTVAQIQAAMCAGPVDAVQNEYHLFCREPEEEVLPFCEDNEISFVAFGPLAFGLLGGRYNTRLKLKAGDWRSRLPLFQRKPLRKALGVIGPIKKMAAARDTTLPCVAIRWVLRHRVVAAAVVGAKNPGQVADNVGAAAFALTDDEIERLNKLTADLFLVPPPAE
jgi:aryl-alcohol dehydrogenase-like predicted oxidoreductase